MNKYYFDENKTNEKTNLGKTNISMRNVFFKKNRTLIIGSTHDKGGLYNTKIALKMGLLSALQIGVFLHLVWQQYSESAKFLRLRTMKWMWI